MTSTSSGTISAPNALRNCAEKCASIPPYAVGLKYRRNAGSGVPWKFGRISDAQRGPIIERVSKSSEGTVVAAKFENDLAADLSAANDAVRFDLSVDVLLFDAGGERAVGVAGGGEMLLFDEKKSEAVKSGSIGVLNG